MLAQDATRIATPDIDWAAMAPILLLIGGAALLLVVDALSTRRPTAGIYALYTVVVAGASIATAVPLWQEVTDPDQGPFTVVAGAIGIDGFSVFFFFIIAVAVILAALVADGYLRREDLDGPEFYVLVMLSASGGMVMAAANDLMVTFLGLEILSIAVYVLAAMHLRRTRSQEAAIKYFVLGAFSSAFFLYGIALVYGATGSTRLDAISQFPLSGSNVDPDLLQPPAVLLAGIALLIVGFGFKVAAVPFHSWTPDVYQGSPTPDGGLHGLGREGGRVRRHDPGARRRPRQLHRRLAALHLRPRRGDAPRGVDPRHRPDRREAHAGLLLDQPRRLHPRRGAAPPASAASAGRSSTSPRTRSWSRVPSA